MQEKIINQKLVFVSIKQETLDAFCSQLHTPTGERSLDTYLRKKGALPVNTEAVEYRANLRGANFAGVNLTKANFYETDLTGANFTEATLVWADLSRANFTEANLTGANLSNAILNATILFKANLTGANFNQAYFYWVNLTGANLSKVNLSKANLSGTNFTGADLTEASFTGANLSETILIGAKLSEENLAFAKQQGAVTEPEDLLPINKTARSFLERGYESAKSLQILEKNEKDTELKPLYTADDVVAIIHSHPRENLPDSSLMSLKKENRMRDRAALAVFEKLNSAGEPEESSISSLPFEIGRHIIGFVPRTHLPNLTQVSSTKVEMPYAHDTKSQKALEKSFVEQIKNERERRNQHILP